MNACFESKQTFFVQVISMAIETNFTIEKQIIPVKNGKFLFNEITTI